MKKINGYGRSRKEIAKKERTIMIVSSAFVLAALTMTGLYVRGNSQAEKQDGYRLDYESLEQEIVDKLPEIDEYAKVEVPIVEVPITEAPISEDYLNEFDPMNNDLDYAPMEAVDSGLIEITEIDGVPLDSEGDILEEEVDLPKEPVEAKEPVAKTTELHFMPEDGLVWPVTGNVLIPYSMDKTVYFQTLDQYKRSAGMVIAAEEGTGITVPVNAKVAEIFADDEIGQAVRLEIGNGYEIVYGQLKDLTVEEGEYLEAGDFVGSVAAPTKYYSVEGTNLYLKLTKDGTPVDPLAP